MVLTRAAKLAKAKGSRDENPKDNGENHSTVNSAPTAPQRLVQQIVGRLLITKLKEKKDEKTNDFVPDDYFAACYKWCCSV
jgi:hypothetical protein